MKQHSLACHAARFVAVLAILMAGNALAQITVGLDSTNLRSGFKPTFYGINGQDRNGLPWANTTSGVLDNPGFASAGLVVTAGGSGYTSAPTVTISGNTGTGAAATATISGGVVTAVNITSGGTGYKPAPQVTVSGGGGSGAQAAAIVSATGVITAVLPINIGSKYTSAPTVTIAANPTGSGATATAVLSGGSVTSYTLTAGGTGYKSAPQVSFAGGGGSGAAASATVSGGAVGPALQQLELGVLRFPAGTGGNYWNASTGDFVSNYYSSAVPSLYLSPLSEWQAELNAASQPTGTAAQGIFVLNMLTDPTCTPISPDPYCIPSATSPNLSNQEALLTTVATSYTKPAYLELGNEYYLPDFCYTKVYPFPTGAAPSTITAYSVTSNVVKLTAANTFVAGAAVNFSVSIGPAFLDGLTLNVLSAGLSSTQFEVSFTTGNVGTTSATGTATPSNAGVYAAAANTWITGIHGLGAYSTAKIAAVGSHIAGNTARAAWNHDLMYGDGQGNGPLTGASAVTIHVYEASGLASGTIVSASNADNMLYQPFQNWSIGTDSILGGDFPSLTNTATGYTPNIWVTEYNLRDAKVAAFGTWAHGLFTASMSLLFLENPTTSRLQMAIHHTAQGGVIYADVFQSTDAFAPPAFAITGQSNLPSAVLSKTYPPKALSVTGGTSPYTWSVSSGTLVPGLSLNSSSGVLSGTPTADSGSPYSFTVTVTDHTLATASANFTLPVEPTGTPTVDCSGSGGVSESNWPIGGAGILTRVNGLTAQGLTTREIDTAALGQTQAQRLTFTGSSVPLFTQGAGTTPELYGWIFSGGTGVPTETVILNLSGAAQTADLSSVAGIAVGNSFRELSSTDPGTYVTGGLVATGYEGVDNNMVGSTTQPVVLTTGTLGAVGAMTNPINTFSLPAFSITRIY